MDKGPVDMVRTETVVRMIPDKRFLLKVEAPQSGTLAWLDHQLSDSRSGCELTMSVIVSVDRAAAGMDRTSYVAATTDALAHTLGEYRARLSDLDALKSDRGP
jgi:hypothetical protein